MDEYMEHWQRYREEEKELQDYEERARARPIPAVSGAIYMENHEKVEDLTDQMIAYEDAQRYDKEGIQFP